MFRLAIFIDGGYLDKVLIDQFDGVKIRYEHLATEIANRIRPDMEILRTYYYHCLPYQSRQPSQEESSRFAKMSEFLDKLDLLPRFAVRRGKLVQRRDEQGRIRYEQKMVDVLLSIDLVQLGVGGKITHAALIAGDSDFLPAVQVAKDAGVSVWLFHGSRPHHELWRAADERLCFDEDFLQPLRRKTASGD